MSMLSKLLDRLRYRLITHWLTVLRLQPGDLLLVHHPGLINRLSNNVEMRYFRDAKLPDVRLIYIEADKPLFTQVSFLELTEIYTEAYLIYRRAEWERIQSEMTIQPPGSQSTNASLGRQVDEPEQKPNGQPARRI